MGKCQIIPRSYGQSGNRNKISTVMLQKLSCEKSTDVLSEGISGSKISGMPCCVDGVTKVNWMNSEEGIQSVLGEVQRIVTQFSLMM